MKTKDIITVVVSFAVIAGAIVYLLGMNKSNNPVVEESSEAEVIRAEYTGDLDKYDGIIEEVNKFTDYGGPSLENIGRENPFAPLN